MKNILEGVKERMMGNPHCGTYTKRKEIMLLLMKKVLSHITEAVEQKGYVPVIKEIARKLDVSMSRVRRAIKDLKNLGAIEQRNTNSVMNILLTSKIPSLKEVIALDYERWEQK